MAAAAQNLMMDAAAAGTQQRLEEQYDAMNLSSRTHGGGGGGGGGALGYASNRAGRGGGGVGGGGGGDNVYERLYTPRTASAIPRTPMTGRCRMAPFDVMASAGIRAGTGAFASGVGASSWMNNDIMNVDVDVINNRSGNAHLPPTYTNKGAVGGASPPTPEPSRIGAMVSTLTSWRGTNVPSPTPPRRFSRTLAIL